MKKEILTIENIKKDLRAVFYSSFKSKPLYILMLLLLYFIMKVYLLILFDPSDSFKTKFAIIFWTICIIGFAYDLINQVICLRKIKNGNFTITSDWVVEKKNKRYGFRIFGIRFFPKHNRFIFAKIGEYPVTAGKWYKWSEMFATTGRVLYENTDINEDFYIISIEDILGNIHNLVVYRKKHFELKEQLA